MRPLGLARPGERLSVLCLGAHSDDVEIGAGGTLLQLLADGVRLDVTWCVLSADGARAREAQASAAAFLDGAERIDVRLATFADGYFPDESRALKGWIEALRRDVRSPDLILTHRGDDAHQDHREVSRLTWTVFRDALVLEYEIPKWDGDLGRPNAYVPLRADVLARKIALLDAQFPTQAGKDWFDADTFRGLARLRGLECRAPERFAEAFTMRKVRLA